MSKFAAMARSANMAVKIYHEIHEMSLRSSESELWAMLSLGEEIIVPKQPPWNHPDGEPVQADMLGSQWMQEHLLQTTNQSNANYATAYYAALSNGDVDHSVYIAPTSRANNWWIESVQWLATQEVFIDGLCESNAFSTSQRALVYRYKPALPSVWFLRVIACCVLQTWTDHISIAGHSNEPGKCSAEPTQSRTWIYTVRTLQGWTAWLATPRCCWATCNTCRFSPRSGSAKASVRLCNRN